MTTTTPTRTPDHSSDATPVVRTGSRHRGTFAALGGVVAGAAIVAGLAFGLAGTGSATPEAPVTPAVPSAPAVPASGASGSGGGSHPVVPTPPAPPAKPSAAIETLQRELGLLNYYEGPVTGTMTPQTVQAITYLQRDAHLPRTGVLDTATTAALQHFLADGNNQMGGQVDGGTTGTAAAAGTVAVATS